ncbi:MAG TPA: hypothetical protein VKM72_15655 [Thermoanaerobaculia bacterium]|nr:hypothetical protein [Thermoanaerobaculia bacterium]
MAQKAAVEAAILLALAGAVWLLYSPALRLGWTDDDFVHLRFLLTCRPFWYFFDAGAYREFPGHVLTPLLFFSLDVDRRLFGLAPHAFYVHHLTALSLCTAALYGALRVWLPRLWSAAGAWLFLAGPVTSSLAVSLPVRHYVEAVLLSALALMAWAAALRRPPGTETCRPAWKAAWVSAGLYFAACFAKEIAVPLCVLLPLLPPPGNRQVRFRERIRLALPHAAALSLYLVIRHALLGTLLGGYGFTVRPADIPSLLLRLPGKIAAELAAGRLSPAAAVFALGLAAGILPLFLPPHGRRAAAPTGLALLLAILPIVPVSTLMHPRLAVPAWLVLAVAFAVGGSALAAAERQGGHRLAAVAVIVACVSGFWLNRQAWSARFAEAERKTVENRFVLEMRKGDVLRQPLTLAASLLEVEWMKERVLRRPRGGFWFQDDLYLCLHRGRLGRVWSYDPGARRLVEVTRRLPALRARHCSSIRSGVPLRVSFQVVDKNLFWDLGPYRDGTYRFVVDDGGQAFEMPRSAGFRAQGRRVLPPLRVQYTSPTGWTTYSPELRPLLIEGWSLDWSRP